MDTGRKVTGGKYHARRKKKHYDKTGQEARVLLGDLKTKQKRIRGGVQRTMLLTANEANIIVKGKAKKAEITNVEETPQNKFLARQNRLMKGSIISTSLGKARITNRPTREGHINAILLESK